MAPFSVPCSNDNYLGDYKNVVDNDDYDYIATVDGRRGPVSDDSYQGQTRGGRRDVISGRRDGCVIWCIHVYYSAFHQSSEVAVVLQRLLFTTLATFMSWSVKLKASGVTAPRASVEQVQSTFNSKKLNIRTLTGHSFETTRQCVRIRWEQQSEALRLDSIRGKVPVEFDVFLHGCNRCCHNFTNVSTFSGKPFRTPLLMDKVVMQLLVGEVECTQHTPRCSRYSVATISYLFKLRSTGVSAISVGIFGFDNYW